MTQQEFKREYDKLTSTYPTFFNNPHREKAVAAYIMDMDYRFWAALVNRILVSGNPKLDIEDAARGERLARRRIKDTETYLGLQTILSEKCTENGLETILEKIGVASLVETIGRPLSAPPTANRDGSKNER